MTVTQVGRDTNGVTINVSGITKGDRQTYIWIPGILLNSNDGDWFTLQSARDRGYVTGIYVADYTTNNGDITVWVSEEYYSEIKVIDLYVMNGINIGESNQVIYSELMIPTILDFEYENSRTKVSGADIDITISDLRDLNLFGFFLDHWVYGGTESGYYYPLDDVFVGDDIYADYLRQPADLIYETAYNCDYIGSNYSKIYTYTRDIINNCVSGADFKASWFNNIAEAIRNFNLSITA